MVFDSTNAALELLQPLLNDPDITEIMVNNPDDVYIVKRGQLLKTDLTFEDEAHILHVINSVIVPLGRRIDSMTPLVDVRLPDGARFSAVIRPVAVDGPTFTVRKMPSRLITIDDLIRLGSLDQKVVEFLQAVCEAKINLVVSGGTNSGKTTLMNVISEFIPANERIITAETVTELKLRHPHVLALEARPPDGEGKGEITMTDLVTNAFSMRPDRIISNEVRGGEAWDMLQAMTLGYDGSMFLIHANNVPDALERLETMCVGATNLPLLQIRARIVQAVQIIIQQTRRPDGGRRIITMAEVTQLKNNVIETHDIMQFEPSGMIDGRITGEFRFTGYQPRVADQLDLPADFFEV